MPAKYIYEPWEAPMEVQKRCGVIVGENYPEPIVEHKSISKSNMSRMKEAYDAHKAGTPLVAQPSNNNGDDDGDEGNTGTASRGKKKQRTK